MVGVEGVSEAFAVAVALGKDVTVADGAALLDGVAFLDGVALLAGAALGSAWVVGVVDSSLSSEAGSTVVGRTLYGCFAKYMELSARDVMTAPANVGCRGYANSGKPVKLDQRRKGTPHVDVTAV